MDRVVIVGGGLAGSRVATELRDRGYQRELVLVGSEPHPPYDRPPLSKRMLLDPEPFDSTLPFDASALEVDARFGTRALGLRPGAVDTDRGVIEYDGAVLATGAEPLRLPGSGGRYLRTREEALELRHRMVPDARVVVVGAGWIGAEVATAAAARGCRTVVLERAGAPVTHALPSDIGALMIPWYAEAGVEFRGETTVSEVGADGVALEDGEFLPADLVVVGIGVRPATGWLDGSPIERDRGVLVGPDLRTSMPGVVAVGDVTARWSPRYGTRIRGEHWDDAQRAPAVAAANLVAAAAGSTVATTAEYDPVPYVWSEQFGRRVLFCGHPAAGVAKVRRDPWPICWLDADDRIVAVLAVTPPGRPRDFVQARKLAEAGTPVDPEVLADPRVPVAQAAKDAVAGSGT